MHQEFAQVMKDNPSANPADVMSFLKAKYRKVTTAKPKGSGKEIVLKQELSAHRAQYSANRAIGMHEQANFHLQAAKERINQLRALRGKHLK
jgi:hypothetical protein